MVGRLWYWLLVVGWAWYAGWPVLASRGQCDVEALRCHVICSFPDLDVHCSRCIRRRPMRFGKRSGEALDPSDESWSGGPLLRRTSNLGSGFPRKARSHKKSTSAISRVQHGRTPAGVRPMQNSEHSNVGLRHFLSKVIWNDDVKRDTPSEELQQPHVSKPRALLYPGGLNDDAHIDIDDSNDSFEHRRRRRSVPTRSDTAGSSTSPSRIKRSKRSSVHDMIEGLMELLGLEELLVDPTLYGCQELLLPVLK